MEYKKTYNPLNDSKILIILIFILLVLIIITIILHKFNLIKPIEIIVPEI